MMLETDLYQPLYNYLTGLGYTVRSEVQNCDIIATQDDRMVVIEMKRSFTLTLLMQAVKRQRIADAVYVAIPAPKSGMRSKSWRDVCHLLRRLELGLIVVRFREADTAVVEIVIQPVPFQRRRDNRSRKYVLREVAGRSSDYNVAGSCRRKLMTAYRENAVLIACCLARYGRLSVGALKKLGTGAKTPGILQKNFYGWFNRVERGIYELDPKGKTGLAEYQELVKEIYDKLDSNSEESF
ncbi:Hypothetical protein LUCI_4412 [Lucifera butyrica]|uniref:Uncharacterized protein n=1 Tax=Lucifera butyrica TaxID=1351585 RepID=A0A498R8U5_9FIRM|nr:DUF2161 family putative PD-(D/E)XK-type phosphodiesterase [Lucifera butyrica]VBB09126.1 Hypothetical protein LUCI_4412 [Lucifera butyrica]